MRADERRRATFVLIGDVRMQQTDRDGFHVRTDDAFDLGPCALVVERDDHLARCVEPLDQLARPRTRNEGRLLAIAEVVLVRVPTAIVCSPVARESPPSAKAWLAVASLLSPMAIARSAVASVCAPMAMESDPVASTLLPMATPSVAVDRLPMATLPKPIAVVRAATMR